MRSRYAAYAVGDTDYVFRTWHPRTRPDDLSPDPARTWTGLTILGRGRGLGGVRGVVRASAACPASSASAAGSSSAAVAGSTSTATSGDASRSGSGAPTTCPRWRRCWPSSRRRRSYPVRWPLPDPGRGLPGPPGRGAGLGGRGRRPGRRPRRRLRARPASSATHFVAGAGTEDLAELAVLFVGSDVIGTGVGGRLHDTAVDWIVASGRQPVLDVVPVHARAVEVYRHRGWRVVGEVQPAWLAEDFPTLVLMTLSRAGLAARPERARAPGRTRGGRRADVRVRGGGGARRDLVAASAQLDHPVDPVETRLGVGDPDDRAAPLAAEHLGRELVGGGAVEVRGRLVEHQHRLVGEQRAGDRDPGPLAARRPGRGRRRASCRGRPAGRPARRPSRAWRSAASTSASVAPGRASRTFSTRVVAKTCGSSSTRPDGAAYVVERELGQRAVAEAHLARGPGRRSAAAARRACSCRSRWDRRRRPARRARAPGRGRAAPPGRPRPAVTRSSVDACRRRAAAGTAGLLDGRAAGRRARRAGPRRPGSARRARRRRPATPADLAQRQRQQHQQGQHRPGQRPVGDRGREHHARPRRRRRPEPAATSARPVASQVGRGDAAPAELGADLVDRGQGAVLGLPHRQLAGGLGRLHDRRRRAAPGRRRRRARRGPRRPGPGRRPSAPARQTASTTGTAGGATSAATTTASAAAIDERRAPASAPAARGPARCRRRRRPRRARRRGAGRARRA